MARIKNKKRAYKPINATFVKVSRHVELVETSRGSVAPPSVMLSKRSTVETSRGSVV